MFRDFINRLIGKTEMVQFNISTTTKTPDPIVHRENTAQAVKGFSTLSNAAPNNVVAKHHITADNLHLCNGKYLHNGLSFKKVPQNVVFGMVRYNGALTISKVGEGQSNNDTQTTNDQTSTNCATGRKTLYFHYGTGEKSNWMNPKSIPMDIDNDGHYYACFPVNVPIGNNKITVHAAIHDGNGVWDNNFGNDYTLEADLKKFITNF